MKDSGSEHFANPSIQDSALFSVRHNEEIRTVFSLEKS